MHDLLQTVIPIVLTALIAGQVAITRTGRLRADIRTSIDLLGKLPAGHPSRATLEANIGELVDVLVRRQRRRFEPFTRAGVWFGMNLAAAGIALTAVSSTMLQATGIWRTESAEQLAFGDHWVGVGFYSALTFLSGLLAYQAVHRRRREHPPSAQQPTEAGLAPD